MDLNDQQVSSILSRSSSLDELSDSDRDIIRSFSKQLTVIAQLLRKEDIGAINDAIGGRTYKTTKTEPIAPLTENHECLSTARSLSREAYVKQARTTYALRRKRTGIFDSIEIFGEPAWDILLDLYIADFEEKPVSVSSACIGSASPPTTGLRWLGVLSDQGLVERRHDPNDQRRILVSLTPHGLECMDAYFSTVARSGGCA